MLLRFGLVLLVAGGALSACAPENRPRPAASAPMAGTAAGSCEEPLSAAARARAGTGCEAGATQGTARITGCSDGPQVAYSGPAMGTLGNPQARRIEPGGERGGHSCN